jgi:putative ABC transport system permease protein
MTGLAQDIRNTLRTMARNRGFTAVAIGTLALGIAANSAIFSVVNAVILRPLPYADSNRLLAIFGVRLSYDRYPLRIPDFLDYRDRNRTFEQLSAYGNWVTNLTGEAEPQRLVGMRVTGNYFPMLGLRATLGRVVTADDDTPARGKVAVLSYGLWKRQFGADPHVLGRKITLSGDPFSVIGVLPPEFVMPGVKADVFVPMLAESDPLRRNRGSVSFLRVFGRLKPGVTIEQAKQDMNSIARQLTLEHPQDYDATINVIPLRDEVIGDVRLMLFVLLAAVAMVLLIACANLASFLLAKASARRKELAIRSALGGSRPRIIRQLLTESMVLALVGGGLGAISAGWLVSALMTLMPASLPRSAEVHVDARMFWLALSLSVASGLIFGLLPAFEASGADLTETLRSEGRTSAGSVGRNRLRRILVSAEVALSLVLLIGAGLLLKSFVRLRVLHPGFDSRNVITARLALPAKRYNNRAVVGAFYDKLHARLQNLPGVESAGAVSILPLSGPIASADFQIAGRPLATGKDKPTAQYRMTDWNYFPSMRMPILRGRNFSERDTAQSQPVAVISETTARTYWPGQDPVGAHVFLEDAGGNARDVLLVGVVGEVRLLDLETAPPPVLYIPLAQIPNENARWIANNMFWVIHTSGNLSGFDKIIRRELHAVDGDVAAANIQPLGEYLATAVAPRRFSLSLITVFAAVALMLAASGLYALISHFVTQRTREIGVRVALGAQSKDIFWQVVGEGLLLTTAGVAVGLAAAFGMVRLISSMLFGVTTHDTVTMLEVSALLIATGIAASYFPACRAVNVDPLTALRQD